MTLEQRYGLFTRQRFTIMEDKLLCRVNTIGRSSEFAIGFNEMAENPTSVKRTPWMWFAVATVAGCAVLAFIVFALMTHSEIRNGCFAGAFLFSLPTVLAIYGARLRMHNSIIFATARGNVVLRQGRPTPEECKEFVQALQHRIADSRDIKQQVARSVLKVLRDEAIIDEWGFRKACERLSLAA